MDKKDIESYLLAVSIMKAQMYFSLTLIVFVLLSLIAFWLGYESFYLVTMVCVSIGYVILYNVEYILGYPVNKRNLLKILKKEIDKDPEAILYMTQLRSKQNRLLTGC